LGQATAACSAGGWQAGERAPWPRQRVDSAIAMPSTHCYHTTTGQRQYWQPPLRLLDAATPARSQVMRRETQAELAPATSACQAGGGGLEASAMVAGYCMRSVNGRWSVVIQQNRRSGATPGGDSRKRGWGLAWQIYTYGPAAMHCARGSGSSRVRFGAAVAPISRSTRVTFGPLPRLSHAQPEAATAAACYHYQRLSVNAALPGLLSHAQRQHAHSGRTTPVSP
jgi:hypothetical protein